MAPATKVKVLHRATEDITDGRNTSTSPCAKASESETQLKQLQAENESLKQRLEQAKSNAAAERKRLMDELRLEKAGRERAEELLVKQSKELESTTAAKGRLEEAFSRSMAEIRYMRLENSQAEATIRQLLRELMLFRELLSQVNSQQGNGSKTPEPCANHALLENNGTASASSSHAACSPALSNKRVSRSKLLGELHQLRQAKAAAESKRDDLLQRLGALEAEKERAEECQEMISKQTAKLLDDKRQLLNDLGTKDEVVRGLASGLDHLQHQLELALQDRELLMQKLTKVADQTEIDALQRAMEEGTYISPATQRRVSLAAQRSSDNDEVVHMVLDETEGVAVNGTGSHHQVAA